MSKKPIIPIFYAADGNYLPYLAVSLSSLKENASREYHYEIYVLHADMSKEAQHSLDEYVDEDFSIQFLNISTRLDEIKTSLSLRDYYTGATYYRIFIASMFPQFDKALYLDSDIILLGDVSELYNVELGDTLVGAIPDGAVAAVPEFRLYTKETLGIDAEKYFNAGVLVMNLKEFRKEDFYGKFCSLLQAYKFVVAQDQDYLNVLCKDKVTYLGEEWNRMPIGGDGDIPKLIHYNLTMKPWHYEGTLFEEYFWKYARRSAFYERMRGELLSYDEEKKAKDAECEKALIALAVAEAKRADNYAKRIQDK